MQLDRSMSFDGLREQSGESAWPEKAMRLALNILELTEGEIRVADVMQRVILMVKDLTGLESVEVLILKPLTLSQSAESVHESVLPGQFFCHRVLAGGEELKQGRNPTARCLGEHIVLGTLNLPKNYLGSGGSFWTNNLKEFFTSSAAKHVRCPLRPPLRIEGKNSLAVVPLRSSHGTIGVIQVSDSRVGRLSPGLVAFMENVGTAVATLLFRMAAAAAESRVKEGLQEQVERLAQARQELLLTQQRQELAIRAGDMGLWDWNITTGEVCYDQGWTSILGYAPKETKAHYRTWRQLIHPEDRRRVIKTLKRYLAGITVCYECEYRLRSKSGDWRWIVDRGKIMERNAHGWPLRMVGIYSDITLRKRVEEALHRGEDRLKRMFETAEDCIYFKDTFLVYTEVNPAMARTLGLPASSIIGHVDEELFGSTAAQVIYESDQLVLRGQTVEQEHTRAVGGANVTFLDLKVPIRGNRGEVMGIFGISRDMTYRRHLDTIPQTSTSESRSPAMRAVFRGARVAAQTDSIVLITGESGTGKDYLARYIHQQSKRSQGALFSINCAAISPELAESEFFGHESGAFTGARSSKKGLLELAEGGTILLNEIGDISPALQSKLLMFLDTRQFTRVGGVKLHSVNARLIAATNQKLEHEVKMKRFRKDLFYRLAVFSIEIPPLRERTEDIPLLISHLLPLLAQRIGIDAVPGVSADALAVLANYRWPGNIRELRNVLERALILSDKKTINVEDLVVGGKWGPRSTDQEWSVKISFPEQQSLNEVVSDLKRRLLVEALHRANGRRNKAAALLGLTADALKHYMKSLGLYG